MPRVPPVTSARRPCSSPTVPLLRSAILDPALPELGPTGGHDENDHPAGEISCLRPCLQLCPPLSGARAGQQALIVQPCHMIVKESPQELRVAEDHPRRDR